MEHHKINELLERQFIIQEEIEALLNESKKNTKMISELSKKSLNFNDYKQVEEPKKNTKNLIKDKLKQMGYIISTQIIDRNQTTIATKNNIKLKVLIKQSKYYSNSSHQAWFTIYSYAIELIDVFIFIYATEDGIENTLVIDKNLMKTLANSVAKMSGGRLNIFLSLKENEVIEYSSKVDLTEYINNFSLFE